MFEAVVETVYFQKLGPQNTTRTLETAKRCADQLGLDTILVASTTGQTGFEAVELFQGHDLVVVSHSAGFSKPNTQQLTEDNRVAIEAAGATILTCQHAFGGVNRAVRKHLGTYLTDEIIAYTLCTFGQGTKVCAAIALMVADTGLATVG